MYRENPQVLLAVTPLMSKALNLLVARLSQTWEVNGTMQFCAWEVEWYDAILCS